LIDDLDPDALAFMMTVATLKDTRAELREIKE